MSNSHREKRCLWIHSLIIIPLISVMVAALYFYPVRSMDWSWSPTHLPAVLELRASKSGEVIEIPLSQYFPRGHLGGQDNKEEEEEGTSPKARLISSAIAESSDGCDLSAVDLQTSQLKSQLDSSINLILVVSNSGCPILRKVENAALAGYFGILIYPSSSSNDDNDSSPYFDPTSDLNSDMGIDLSLLVAITQDKSVGVSIREKYCHPRRFWATFRPPQNKLTIWYGQFQERSHQLVEELHKLTGNKLRLQGQTLVFLGASLALLLGAIWAAAHFSKSGREARKMRRFKEYERMYRAKCEEDRVDEEEEEEQEGQGQSEDELEGQGQGQSQSEEEDDQDDDDEEEQEEVAENGLDKMKRCREALGLPRKLWIPFSSFDILVAYQQKIREIDPDLDNDNDNDDGHFKSRKSRLTIGQRREMKRLERAMNFLVQNNNAK